MARKVSIFLALLAAPALWAADTQTIAGTGKPGYGGDGGAGTKAQVNNPYGLTVGPDGALYFCDIDNHVIRKLNVKTGVITTVAGNAKKGYSGDNGPAMMASLNQPYEIRFDKAGNMFFVEMPNHVVRKVDKKSGIITTVAGTGQPGFSGDGGPGVKAMMRQPHSIQFDPLGRLLRTIRRGRRLPRVAGQVQDLVDEQLPLARVLACLLPQDHLERGDGHDQRRGQHHDLDAHAALAPRATPHDTKSLRMPVRLPTIPVSDTALPR